MLIFFLFLLWNDHYTYSCDPLLVFVSYLRRQSLHGKSSYLTYFYYMWLYPCAISRLIYYFTHLYFFIGIFSNSNFSFVVFLLSFFIFHEQFSQRFFYFVSNLKNTGFGFIEIPIFSFCLLPLNYALFLLCTLFTFPVLILWVKCFIYYFLVFLIFYHML